MEIFDYLEGMQIALTDGNLFDLEQKYLALCSDIAGESEAKRIQSINLDGYKDSLTEGISRSLELARHRSSKAVYFEYDMDNDWISNFFICDEYAALGEQDEDWASEWSEEVTGPELLEFADIYAENGFDASEKAIGITLYLVARTVSALASVCQQVQTSIPICIAFHDQDPIMRIKE